MVGGPQNLYNLFSQFPKENYAVVSAYGPIANSSVLGSWLDGPYYFYDHRGPVERINKPKSSSGNGASQLSPIGRLLRFCHRVPVLGDLLYIPLVLGKIILMTTTARLAVKEQRASILLGISDHGPAIIATWIVARLTKRPYIIYLYDLYKGNNLTFIDRLFAACLESTIFRGAQTVIVTNEETEAYYRERYGQRTKLSVIHNSVFPEVYAQRRQTYQPKPPYSILFTGHVYWAQEQSVLNLIQAMDQLTDIPVQLDLYVPDASENIKALVHGRPNIKLQVAAQSEMPAIQGAATLLFLPLAWHTSSPAIIRTASPGKFTDYLAAGRPILVHAPDYAFVSRYVRKNQLGIVVDNNEVAALAKAIREFLADPVKGKAFVERSIALFEKEYDAKKNAEKLRTLLFSNMVAKDQ